MQRDILKIIVTIFATLFFIWSDYDPVKNGIMHAINFPIHEIGHVVFGSFGEFIAVAGGSIFQIIVPIGFFYYFFFREEFFSAAFILFWVGNNFFDVAAYADDAVFMELPLANFSGNANEENAIHDWNYLLTKTNMLPHTHQVAEFLIFIGLIITFAAIVGTFHYTRKEEITNLDS